MNTRYTFRVYKDARNEWRWTLRSSNGRKVADSAEGYKRRSACIARAHSIGNFPIEVVDD